MKIKANRPIYKDGKVILAGEDCVTSEQHGRELVTRGYATEPAAEKPKAEPKKAPTKKES